MIDFVPFTVGVHFRERACKAILGCVVIVLPACGFFGGLKSPTTTLDSAPNVTMKASKITAAEPRIEAKSRGGNRSVYTVFGKSYRVLESADGFKERGEASWYGKKFHGRDTANGERYDMYSMTAAHKHLPLPSYVRVTNLENGKSTIVRVNDRGPFHGGRIIDLSYAAATKLDMLKNGTARVEVEVIDVRRWVEAKKSGQKTSLQSQALATSNAPLAPAARPANVVREGPITSKPKRSAHALSNVAGVNIDDEAGRHYLQVAAFQSLATAQGIQNQLLEKINTGKMPLQAHNVVIHPSASSELYRVRIGPVASRLEVERLKEHPLLDSFGNMYPVTE